MDSKQAEIAALVRAATDKPPYPFVFISDVLLHDGIDSNPIWDAKFDLVCRLNKVDQNFLPFVEESDEDLSSDEDTPLTYSLHIAQVQPVDDSTQAVYFIYLDAGDCYGMSDITMMAGTFASLAGVKEFLVSYVQDWAEWSYEFANAKEGKPEIVEMLEQLPTSTGKPIQYDEFMGL